MPRAKRKVSSTKIYHIMMRALNKQMLFEEENDYLHFLKILFDVKHQFHFKIYAYCLMDNHIHLLLKDMENNLSKSINILNQKYAQYYNLKNRRTGYVFNDRFHSEPVENKDYFFRCIRYIHQNPVKALICEKTYKYKFSSIHAYRTANGNYLGLVNANEVARMVNMQAFVLWNDMQNHDICMEVVENYKTDKDVLEMLLKFTHKNTRADFTELTEAEKAVAILQLLDICIPMMQISRVSGMSYGKIQKLRKGVEGTVKSLTFYK